jgi:PAS domain S-box-containing protein
MLINLIGIIMIPFMLFLSFKSFLKGNKIALFYIVAQSTFMICSFFFSLMAYGYIEYNLYNRNAIVVSSFVEIILFSLALGYRLRLSQIEKLEIISKTNIELKEKIELRTLELKNMLDRTMEAVGIYENHICIETNDAAVEIYGYDSKEQMRGKKAIHFIAPSSRKLALKYMRDVYTKPYEIMALRADGSQFPVLVKGSHYQLGDRVLGMVAVLDLSDIKEKEKELIVAKNRAEEVTQAKSNFLANMSHEIRTPMNAIIGMSELMKKTKLNHQQQHYIDVINGNAISLLNIINDILDFSKIEAGKVEINKIDFNLKEMLFNISI